MMITQGFDFSHNLVFALGKFGNACSDLGNRFSCLGDGCFFLKVPLPLAWKPSLDRCFLWSCCSLGRRLLCSCHDY
jgi:hypothetical protein